MNIGDFKYTVISPKGVEPHELRDRSFEMWYEVWTNAYKAYWGSSEIFSDQFTRQAQQGILEYQGEVIGTLAFDLKNLELKTTREDSYFRMWDEVSYQKLKDSSDNGKVLVCSWFTLSSKFRKENKGFDAKRLLVEVGIRHFEASLEKTMVGTMVHVGNLQEVCYDLGSTCIRKDHEEKGLPVDLMFWSREKSGMFLNYKFKTILDNIIPIKSDSLSSVA